MKTIIGTVINIVDDTILELYTKEEQKLVLTHDLDPADARALVGIEIMCEVDGNHIVSSKAVTYAFDMSKGLAIENLTIDESPFEALTLDMRTVREDLDVFSAYCVDQKTFSNMRSTYITFTLRDKNNKEIKANMFTDRPNDVPNCINSIINVAIRRKDVYFNIESIEITDKISIKDPKVEKAREFLQKTFLACKDDLGKFSNTYQDIKFELTNELTLKLAYGVNLTLMYKNNIKFDQYEVLKGLLFYTLGDLELALKDAPDEFFNRHDASICKAIKLRCLDTRVMSYFSEGSEYYKKEAKILALIIAQTEELYRLEHTYDFRMKGIV